MHNRELALLVGMLCAISMSYDIYKQNKNNEEIIKNHKCVLISKSNIISIVVTLFYIVVLIFTRDSLLALLAMVGMIYNAVISLKLFIITKKKVE